MPTDRTEVIKLFIQHGLPGTIPILIAVDEKGDEYELTYRDTVGLDDTDELVGNIEAVKIN